MEEAWTPEMEARLDKLKLEMKTAMATLATAMKEQIHISIATAIAAMMEHNPSRGKSRSQLHHHSRSSHSPTRAITSISSSRTASSPSSPSQVSSRFSQSRTPSRTTTAPSSQASPRTEFPSLPSLGVRHQSSSREDLRSSGSPLSVSLSLQVSSQPQTPSPSTRASSLTGYSSSPALLQFASHGAQVPAVRHEGVIQRQLPSEVKFIDDDGPEKKSSVVNPAFDDKIAGANTAEGSGTTNFTESVQQEILNVTKQIDGSQATSSTASIQEVKGRMTDVAFTNVLKNELKSDTIQMVTKMHQSVNDIAISQEEEPLGNIVRTTSLDLGAWTTCIKEIEKADKGNILKKYVDHEACIGSGDIVGEVLGIPNQQLDRYFEDSKVLVDRRPRSQWQTDEEKESAAVYVSSGTTLDAKMVAENARGMTPVYILLLNGGVGFDNMVYTLTNRRGMEEGVAYAENQNKPMVVDSVVIVLGALAKSGVHPQNIAIEESVFTQSEAKLGMLVRGKVNTVDSFYDIFQIASGTKENFQPRHMSEIVEKLGKRSLEPGFENYQLLVLDVGVCKLVLSAKYALISPSQHFPLDFSQALTTALGEKAGKYMEHYHEVRKRVECKQGLTRKQTRINTQADPFC